MNFARDNDESLNDSNLNYLYSPSSFSLPVIDPQIAFQNAFERYDAVTMTIFCGIFHSRILMRLQFL